MDQNGNRKSIPFNRPFCVGKELYYIAQAVMVDSHISGDGRFTKLCHKWLEETLGTSKALLTHSCTAALEMAAILCDLGPGDEVVLPSFTFVSTANAFVLRGATPVFVDIRHDNLTIDEKLLEQALTPRTKAVVPVHYAGTACEMDEIMSIAASRGMIVIEDAAQALLSTYNGAYLGTMGSFGCLSFHETKNVISGEGGALLINDPAYVERAEIIREKGTNRCRFFRGEVDKYSWVDLGSSFLPSELIGAFLYAQLEHAEQIVKTRRAIFDRYYRQLEPLAEKELLILPIIASRRSSNGHMFYIITRSLEERTGLIRYLKEQDVSAIFHYVPLHSSPAGRKYGRVAGRMDVTDDMSDRLLRLPLYFEMTDKEVDRVVELVWDFYSSVG
ncbi:MAG: dTDP-4-amino-4,6-dideoxygalactose transaminase [Desulfomonile tiedjei]|uniref:dTDP-4-amino-4,6-dideoxygalactose transaminase n=1 Tax=Desulfomonile tiedjei TaxID=2358 RepID=A0A9D6V339_9BACT|nr:dTDP-4-amino-4,6-dideoxygalactose transaminase [Desulfomonile tiedjei]